MLQLLSGNPRTVDALGFLLAFALTALMDSVFHDKLPHDHGRAFAVNGELSKGKARGSGLIFVLCIALVTLAVVPFKAEYVIYTVLLIASMLSGYFDDAAETAWNEYKKGLIDLVIAVVAGVTYLNFNGTEVNFLSWSFSLPYAVYLILIIVLIWASINVVNCTDGVDGLSASLAVVSIGTFLLAYWEELGDYATAGIVFIGALLAYLWQNAKPSTLLMGDAGSRAMGFFLAVLALKSGHPFAFLLAALVFIVDGSLGILKISFKRFLHISILKNTLTPLHDCASVWAGVMSRSWPAGSSCRLWHPPGCCCWCGKTQKRNAAPAQESSCAGVLLFWSGRKVPASGTAFPDRLGHEFPA